MNEQKIEEIQNRVNYLLEKAKNTTRGSFSLARDMNQVMREDLEEYNALTKMLEIINDNTKENGIPFINVEGAIIKETNRLDYLNALERTALLSHPESNIENTIEELDNNGIENDEIEQNINKSDEEENLEELSPIETAPLIDNDENVQPLLLNPAPEPLLLNPASEEKIEIEKGTENEEEQIEDIKKENNLIPGTNIEKPRKKREDESYEDYEDYLKEHYKKYGIGNNEVEYYPGTEIPKPRDKYPHEILDGVAATDPYYDDMLNYYAEKYKPTQNTEETEIGEDEHEVVGVRKPEGFLKRHKKALLIAAGVTAVALLAQPVIIPAIMHANSVLWSTPLAKAFPAIQSFLHGCNSVLGNLIGASFDKVTGIWTAAAGTINADAASASLLSALATHAVGIGAVAKVAKKAWNAWKNRKSKKKETIEENEPKIENTEEVSINEKESDDKTINIENSNDLSLDNIASKKNYYINAQTKVAPQFQAATQQILADLNRMQDIIINGKNTPNSNVVDFNGNMIAYDDVLEFKELADKYKFEYKVDNNLINDIISKKNTAENTNEEEVEINSEVEKEDVSEITNDIEINDEISDLKEEIDNGELSEKNVDKEEDINSMSTSEKIENLENMKKEFLEKINNASNGEKLENIEENVGGMHK